MTTVSRIRVAHLTQARKYLSSYFRLRHVYDDDLTEGGRADIVARYRFERVRFMRAEIAKIRRLEAEIAAHAEKRASAAR